jgi:Phage integrase family
MRDGGSGCLRRPCYRISTTSRDSNLRCGEIMGFEWSDVDLSKRQLRIERSVWKGHVTVPKGGRLRYVPLTTRLANALGEHRHLKGSRVLCSGDGSPLTQQLVQGLVATAARRANLRNVGVHVLSHTFCSHLVMRGAGARAIQELAGHRDLSTTHVSPAAVERTRFGCWSCHTSPLAGERTGRRWLPPPRTPRILREIWLRGRDLNPRPLGYEPNELPDCSTPRH